MIARPSFAGLRAQVGEDRSRLVDGDEQALLALGLLALARRGRAAASAGCVAEAASERGLEVGSRDGRPFVLLHGLGSDDLLAGEELFEECLNLRPFLGGEVAGSEGTSVADLVVIDDKAKTPRLTVLGECDLDGEPLVVAP